MSSRTDFISLVTPWAMVDTYQNDLACEEMYAFDIDGLHRTGFSEDKNDRYKSFFPNDGTHIRAFVCMPVEPKLRKTVLPGPRTIPILQRTNEIEKFRVETNGVKVIATREYILNSDPLY